MAQQTRTEPQVTALLAWLRRVALSLLFALAAGLIVFIVARGISGALLFIEHQELLRSATAALRNGIEGLPTADLRAARLRAEQSADMHMRIGLILAFVTAALAAAGGYLWLEQRAARDA
ncbi:hypothetical protein [Roseiflexus sp.]|uniref:hypothetical protein n=1 Tax=Roseiflexus sp. TaxID=2562120 RepID=UPI0021DEC26E|nr:hypothetical protein [Roseiflexus sp.]GIW00593.1 MAG: hypothetical protein KatS3mg058_1996 [Roseiflexus sp.]